MDDKRIISFDWVVKRMLRNKANFAVLEGLLYIFLRVPTMIVSLGVVMLYEALSGILFNGGGVQLYVHERFLVLSMEPWCYLVLLAVLAVSGILIQGWNFLNEFFRELLGYV